MNLFDRLSQSDELRADHITRSSHEEVFSQTNCLECAACCKSANALLEEDDIVRLANRLSIAVAAFMGQYALLDEDGDWVLDGSPCPFLQPDNRCSVYEDRPASCRDYPHTGRKKLVQYRALTERNAAICPAVNEILTLIEKKLDQPS